MKRLLLVLSVLVIGASVWASGWHNCNGTSSNPILNGYYTNMYSNTIVPLTANTGQLGTSTNSYNSVNTDSVMVRDGGALATYMGIVNRGNGDVALIGSDSVAATARLGAELRVFGGAYGGWEINALGGSGGNGWLRCGTFWFPGTAAFLGTASGGSMYFNNVNDNVKIFIAGSIDSSGGWFATKTRLKGLTTGSTIIADTMKPAKGLSLRSTATSIMIDSAVIKADSLIFYVGGVGYGSKQKF